MSIYGNSFKSQEEIDAYRSQKLHDIYVELRKENKRKSIKLKNELPIAKTSKEIETTLNSLKRKLEQQKLKWDKWKAEYENFDWWNKLECSDGPDYSEIKTQIEELEEMNANFKEKGGDNLSKLNDHLKHQFNLRKRRIKKAYGHALKVQAQCKNDTLDGEDLIRKSFWCAILSVPVSVGLDLINAHNVYDSLRHVNKNYLDMSDGEIWWTTLWMAPEKLQGLASLTKGAYFEGLVAANTGGQLHEHFNHPGTDIVIDGVEMQIKATGSIDYINSVDDDILVIATSEVAAETGSIDGGYTNEELTDSVGLALGGSVVNIPDTAIDAILSGVGGLGIFATLKGLNSARQTYKKGGDNLESFMKGASVLITETLKTMVNAGAMAVEVVKWPATGFVAGAVWEGAKVAGGVAIPVAKAAGGIAIPVAKAAGGGALKATGLMFKIGKKLLGG
jgi:hypothetical protein